MNIGLEESQKSLHYFCPELLEFSPVKTIFIDSKYTEQLYSAKTSSLACVKYAVNSSTCR